MRAVTRNFMVVLQHFVSFSAPPDPGAENPFNFSPGAVAASQKAADKKEKSPTRDFFRSFSLRRRSNKSKAQLTEEPSTTDADGSQCL